MMDNSGQIYATDIDKRQLAPIHERLTRAGVRNVQVRTPRGAPPDSRAGGAGLGWGLGDLSGKADLVVIDAPCTGTGTWRRNPDAKWRVRPGALEERIKEQGALLERAVPLLKRGGRIAYITCSVLAEENGDQIRDFVGRCPEFVVENPAETAKALGERAYLFTHAALISAEGLQMTPRRTDTDGFFVSVLRRAA
jgi:16S rRNA (cytosine967-C5)-methyltransferase